MSIRTLIEINHDYAHKVTLDVVPFLQQYLASGAKDDAARLERFGIKVVGMRHHADKFVIDARADGFPPKYLDPPHDRRP